MTKARALKRRYILFENLSGISDEDELKRALREESLKFFGEYGLSFAAIKLVKFDGRQGVIRCSRDYQDKVLGFLALSALRLKALKSSGTLKSLVSVSDSIQRS